MSLPHETMLELMAYADGELDGEERARVEKLLASSVEAKRVLSALRGVGEWARAGYVAPEPPAGIVDAVMDRVKAEARGESQAPRAAGGADVVDLAAARARRTRNFGLGAALVAAAAGVVFVMRGGGEEPRTAGVVPTTPVNLEPSASATPDEPPLNVAANAAASAATQEVEQVDSPSHPVSVFYLPAKPASAGGSGAAASVVVWIDDKGGSK